MSRAFYLHPACRPFSCGTCGVEIDGSGRVVTRDGLEICEACDDAADEREAGIDDTVAGALA